MIESPLLKELFAEKEQETMQGDILDFLTGRFTAVPEDLAREVRAVTSRKRLKELIQLSAKCKSLKEFQKRLEKDKDAS